MDASYRLAIGQDRSHVIHPFSQLAATEVTPDDMYVGGDGCYLEDARGNRLFDANAGLWCVNVGYGREEMVEAIREQAGRMSYGQIFARNANLPSAELAARLTEMAPDGFNRVFFSTGGSIANETAVRTVHHYFRLLGRDSKRFVISVDNSYHGSTYLAASLTFSGGNYHDLFHVVDVVHRAASPYPYRAPEGLEGAHFVDYLGDEMERLITRLGADNIACFILEPILGAGGVIVPPEGYHARMVEICRANDIFVIADEVVTGFGRLGHFMAAEPVFGMEADVITLGKGISSGYQPLAAALVSDRIYEVISSADPSAVYAHGFTHSGHPVCCAAGLMNIEIMEREDICGRVDRVGAGFQARLRDLGGSPLVGEVRGMGFMAAVELVADKNTRETFPPEAGAAGRVEAHCRSRGLIVRPLRRHVILSPPLVMTAEEGVWVVEVIQQSLERVESELRAEGLLA